MNLGQFTECKLLVPRLLSEWRDCASSELSLGTVLQHVRCVAPGRELRRPHT
jgi:hypothetical protein